MIEAAIALLGRVPWLAWALLLALSWGGLEALHAGNLEDALAAQQAEAKAVLERTRSTYARAAADAASAALAETERRLQAQQGAIHEAESKAAQARADAAAAGDASRKLRDRFAALAARSCGSGASNHPAPAGSGQAAEPAADLLADVLERVSEAAGSIALAADQSRIAGNACESAYSALMR